jgi:serine/threonine-protein kinase
VSDLSGELALAVGQQYRLVRELGGGGMSRVFLAEERTLAREVVIKVLPREMAVGVNVDRFRREMQLVARLQHPHVVPILSTGAAGDLLYYVMPFITGESLRARLAREGALPVAEAARILREVADALGFAHAQGVVHRDVKPDNVLMSAGHALVTDFGIAKALGAGAANDPAHGGLTSLGLAVGTPAYMAPEQAAADPHVDHRADLYAFGVMAYELLLGRPPFVASSPQALIAAHLTREPAPLRAERAAIPEALEALVLRCLAKRPEDRVQQASELLPLLGQVAAGSGAYPATVATPAVAPVPRRRVPRAALVAGVLLAAVGLGAAGIRGLGALGIGPSATLLSAGTIAERDRIVVAEFANTTGDSTLGYALTEALTIDLSQSRVVRLLSPGEARDALTRMQRDPATPLTAEVATELAAREGIKAVVAGEIAPFAGGYAISVRVLDPAGEPLLAARATADGPSGLLPGLEQVSRELREGIGESVRSIRGTQPLEKVSTASLEALQLYSRAVRGKSVGEDADHLSLLRQAVALDSNFAMAWIQIASVLINANGDITQTLDAAERARRLTDRLPAREALQTRGFYHLQFDRDQESAAEAFQRLLAQWPDDVRARNALGLLYRSMGRYEDAEAQFAPAVWDGTAPASYYYNLVTARIPQGKFDSAASTVRLMRERFPKSPQVWQVQYFVASATQRWDEAFAAADSLTRAGVRYRYWGWRYQGEVAALRGRMREAERAAERAIRAQREQGNAGGALLEATATAWTSLALLGDTARVAARLREALAETPIASLPLASRPYGDVIRLHAALGQVDAARRLAGEYARTMPAAIQKGDVPAMRGLAELALAEGDARRARSVAERASRLSGCGGCLGDLLGRVHEALGDTAAAIAAYERALLPPTYGSDIRHWRESVVPRALLRLGDLYDRRGDREKARERYGALVDQWKDADPELQPVVRDLRQRIGELTRET